MSLQDQVAKRRKVGAGTGHAEGSADFPLIFGN